ncbi:MAG: hypothetical protein ACUVRP_08760 [Chlorobiales bacterium]
MQILSHRGYWKKPEEKNSELAFRRSFELGFGTETDFRDFNGQLVISHDVPTSEAMNASRFFEIYNEYQRNLPLAINIKSDGLHHLLRELLDKYNIQNYFLFDMSVPDGLVYVRQGGFQVFTRQSEYEKEPAFYEEAQGVWMDMFLSDWVEEQHLAIHLEKGKLVCIVSPELHKREHTKFWEKLKRCSCLDSEKLLICTDFPKECETFFN